MSYQEFLETFLDGCEWCPVNDIDILQWGEAY